MSKVGSEGAARELIQELSVEVTSQCISWWRPLWETRYARVNLLVDLGDRFPIIVQSKGFWYLPGGGAEIERNESIEDVAKREAEEELGLEIKVDNIIKIFFVKLFSTKTEECLNVPPYITVHCSPIGGQLRMEYDPPIPNWRIRLGKKKDCEGLVHDNVPIEYQGKKPHFCISKEIVRQLFVCKSLRGISTH